MDTLALIQKIKDIEGISSEEKAYLVNLVNSKKKYGLVWEDKPEAVEELLRSQLPVLREVPEKRILATPQTERQTQHNENATLFENQDEQEEEAALRSTIPPNHVLIEGDNLHALTALSFTHEGKIDVIYIDPPYNTGNKDFKYNDSFVDKEDSYRHSKWLSFMEKRLKIARQLLSDKGVIFISIDDNEQAQLKLLCDEVFGEQNFVCNFQWKGRGGRQDSKHIANIHESILSYSKILDSFVAGTDKGKVTNEIFQKFDIEKKIHYKTQLLRKWGSNSRREDRPNLFYPITTPFGVDLFPMHPDGKEGCWRWGKSKMALEISNGNVEFVKKGNDIIAYEKIYQKIAEETTKGKKYTSWLDDVGATANGSSDLKELFHESKFSYPKPLKLIERFLMIGGNQNSTILDFFAGSGTTLHATMALNAEDGGSRQCILVTNNENNICEEVTYERNKRVIQGYTNSKGVAVAGLSNNNLRYYRCDFIAAEKTEANKRELTRLSTDLLCIKEDCYHDYTEQAGFIPNESRIFTDGQGKYMIVVYHSRQYGEVCERLVAFIDTLETQQRVKLYVFAPEQDTIMADFQDVADKIEAVPLPEAIYNAYRATFKTLKLDKKAPATPEEGTPTEEQEAEGTLFSHENAE